MEVHGLHTFNCLSVVLTRHATCAQSSQGVMAHCYCTERQITCGQPAMHPPASYRRFREELQAFNLLHGLAPIGTSKQTTEPKAMLCFMQDYHSPLARRTALLAPQVGTWASLLTYPVHGVRSSSTHKVAN